MTALTLYAQMISRLRLRAMVSLAFGLGLFGGFFGHAPWRLAFIFLLIVPLLVWMLDGIAKQYLQPKQKIFRAFLLGYIFALGYFLSGLYWIAHAFLLTPLASLAPFGVFGLSAYLAVFSGAAFAASICVWPSGGARFLSLALFWALGECARGFVATGFEWNLIAQSWLVSDALAQNFSWLGIHGATLVMVAVSASLAALSAEDRIRRIRPPLIALGVFFALWAAGAWRLSAAPPPLMTEFSTSSPEIIIIQPNIAQRDKWNPGLRDQIINTYLTMSANAFNASKKDASKKDFSEKDSSENKAGQKIMIWPEAAIAVDIERQPSLRTILAKMIPERSFLIAGLLRFDRAKNHAFNSVYLITDQGRLQQVYDKNHLVPYGEYLPFQSFLESLGLRQLAGRRGGYSEGQARNLLHHQGSPRFAPLICYEIIFAREVPGTKTRPDGLINVTNDGWYGLSTGPHQHFDLSRLRAIEQGLPVLRAANTGISAIIDPYGRIIAQQELGSQGVIRAAFPPPLSPTFYARWGDWIFIILLALATLAIISQRYNQ